MTQNYNAKSFESSDLGLAAAIVSAGYPIDHLDKQNTSKVKFIFIREEGMDEVIQGYWNNALKLSLLMYFNNIKMLKNRIYSERV